MGPRMFLLLVLGLLIFTDHSQGLPETREQSLIVSTFTDASDTGKPLTTANPINTPRKHNRSCNCKGKEGKVASPRCLCQESAKRNGRQQKVKRWCQRKEHKNLKKCSQFFKPKKGTAFAPSVPI
ncbi:uncharacterized protein AB9X84_023615 [Acanthopagrus schlegelii]